MSIELTWLGHACWLIKYEGHRILLDPYLNDSPTAPMKAADVDERLKGWFWSHQINVWP